jgi:SAM-dependent methyltransferase
MSHKTESIVIVGFGWVGQANALGLSLLGHEVSYFDVGKPQLHYVEKYKEVYDQIPRRASVLENDSESTWYVVCVGDRVDEGGFQDISSIEKALESLKNTQGGVVLRSTVLPESLKALDFDYYVPEFLHEKFAVEESVNPHYFVLGARKNVDEIPSFLREWESHSQKVFRGSPEEASFVKYLSNIWNAVRIAFVNEFGDIVGEPKTTQDIAKIEKVLDFVLDRKMYLRYGKSFGGHCLPKDIRAFVGAYSESHTTDMLAATYATNTIHKEREEHYENLPEWFSSWNEGVKENFGFIGRMWRHFNGFFFVKKTRNKLRFLKDWVESIIGKPSFNKQKKLWDERAEENERYYMNPRTKSGYAVNEEEFVTSGADDVKFLIMRDPLLLEKMGSFKDKNILEIGSGSGRMTLFLADIFRTVYVTDISEKLLTIAKNRLTNYPNILYASTQGAEIPYDNEQIDFVFSYLSLHTVPDRDAMATYFREIAQILKKGGIAKIHLRTGREPRKWTKTYGVALSPREARKLSEWAGLTPLRHEVSEGGNHMWVWLLK